MKKEFITKKLIKENQLKTEKAILESFAKTFNKIKRLDESEINLMNEELYDFISDFKRTEGRPPTQDEINKLYYGKDSSEKPSNAYQQSGPDGFYIGDTVKNKKTGELYIVTKEPYSKGKWADDGRSLEYVKAINIEDEKGNKYWASVDNYEKVYTEKDLADKADLKAKDAIVIDQISQMLVDAGFFDTEVKSGEMFNSFTKGKLKHNEDIRNAIRQFANEKKLPEKIVDVYWHKFW